MKKLLLTLTIGITFLASPAAFAQAKKKEPAKPAEAPAAADDKKPAAKPEAKPDAKAEKTLPMNATATEIDAAAKTFTHVTKEGKRVKHTVTATTEIKNGEAAAKFEDIKVGDQVSGSRKKNADGTEYEVVKITKFGPKAAKKTDDKPAEKPAAKPAKKAE